MKKVLCLFVACMLLAGTAFSAGGDTQFGFAPPIQGVAWGMSYDDVAKQLKLQKDDALYAKGKTSALLDKNAVIFGQKATVQLLFDEKGGIGLDCIRVNYSKMDMDAMRKRLARIYGNERALDEWDSVKISDLQQNIQDRFKYLKVELPAKVDTTGILNPKWADIKDRPLASVIIGDSKTLYFGAEDMAAYQIISNDTAYTRYLNWINAQINSRKTKGK